MAETLDGRPLTWLAGQTGDDYKNVQRWVSGSTAPPVDFAGRFAAATGVDGHWLLTGEGQMKRPDPDQAVKDLAEIRRILREGD